MGERQPRFRGRLRAKKFWGPRLLAMGISILEAITGGARRRSADGEYSGSRAATMFCTRA
jgi:hypothetical protein